MFLVVVLLFTKILPGKEVIDAEIQKQQNACNAYEKIHPVLCAMVAYC